MSRRRAVRPSMRYSLSPERYRRRVMVISAVFGGCSPSTGCVPVGLRGGIPSLHVGIDQGHGDVGHAERLAVARAGEDHVFHAGAAQALGGLLAEHPTDGVADVGFAAAVGADNGGDARPVEPQFGAVAEGLESLEFDAFEFQQSSPSSLILSPRAYALDSGDAIHLKRGRSQSKGRGLQNRVVPRNRPQ